MARDVVVQITCDICGSRSDAESVVVAHEGSQYEVDLCKKHRTEYNRLVVPYVDVGRPRLAPDVRGENEASNIRAWARTQGYEIGTRGRLSSTVIHAYQAARAAS